MYSKSLSKIIAYVMLPVIVLYGVMLSLWWVTGYTLETLWIAVPASFAALWKAGRVADWLSQ